MKHKILIVLLSVVMLFVFVLGFSACKDGINGADGEDGKDGIDGADGKDGTGVADAYIDGDGNLIIVLTDGTIKNCGKIKNNQTDGTEGLYYIEIKNGGNVAGYSVRGYGSAYETDVVIPAVFNGKPVLEICGQAFEGCEYLTSVTVPDSVVKIGEKAFYNCGNLTSVTMGGGISEIGNTAFGKCVNLETVNLTDVGNWCEVTFGNLSSNPFYFASDLCVNGSPASELTIPATVSRISDFAFYGCNSITSLKTGSGVASIGDSAFYECENLKSVTVGIGVTTIGDSAFINCINLKQLALGGKVKSIAGYAFAGCTSLSALEIPSSVEIIGEGAFAACESIKTLTLNYGLKVIGDSAFAGCVSLEEFIMPDSVTELGFGAVMFELGGAGFEVSELTNCLTRIRISDSLTEIPDYAFSKSNITSAVIGKKVNTIRYSSFYGCGLLESLVIPKSVKRIQSYAFLNCNALIAVYFEGTAQEWESIVIGKNGNDNISNAVKYFYSETQPSGEGYFWHYQDGVPIIW